MCPNQGIIESERVAIKHYTRPTGLNQDIRSLSASLVP